MTKLLSFLQGRRTYLVAGIVAGLTFAQMVGWITQPQYETLVGFLGALGLYTLRSGITDEVKKIS